MDNRHLILHFDDNYADEFDLQGYDVITKTEYDNIMIRMEEYLKVNRRWYFSFGTNEEIEYESFDSFFNAFSTTLISEEEYAVLAKLGLTSSGVTPVERLLDTISREGDDE